MKRILYLIKRSEEEIYELTQLELVDGQLSPAIEKHMPIGISVTAEELKRLNEHLPILGHDGDEKWAFVPKDSPYPSNLAAIVQLKNPDELGTLINCTIEQVFALCEHYDGSAV